MTACLWCSAGFEPRASGGKPQRFCSKDCRVDFHAAARSWAEQAVMSGLVPVSAFRMAREQRARWPESRLGLRGTSGASRTNSALAPDLAAAVGDEAQEQAHGEPLSARYAFT